MPGMKPSAGFAFFVHALVEQAHADDLVSRSSISACERFRHRRAGPDLDGAGALHLRADPLHELAHREHHAAALVQKRRRPRQVQRVALERQHPLEVADQRVRQAQRHRAPAGADGVEQVKHFFLADRRGHRECRPWIEIGKTRAQRAGAGDDAGHAEADVVGAFVAEHLRRHAGHDGAFDGGRAVGVDELLGQRGEKSRRGRAEADADDVHVHALAFNGSLSGVGHDLVAISRADSAWTA
jgi:hypothetical protein